MTIPIPLNYKTDRIIEPTAPFNFNATLHKPDHFPSGDDNWEPGYRWQTILWQHQPLGLLFANQGNIESPLIQLSIFSKEELDETFLDGLIEELYYRCNLQMDLGSFNEQFYGDPLFKDILHRWWGMRPVNFGSLYEYLIITIVLQNATVKRSVNMLQSLFENYGRLLAFDNKILYCFMTPEKIHSTSEQELRNLKVGYRAKTIKRVTEAFVCNIIDEYSLREKSVDEQKQALLKLYGIGPASVGYILFDVFHQMDHLSHISPWEQKIYSKMFFNTEIDEPVTTDILINFFDQHFSGYRMLAVHYFWEDLFWKQKCEEIGG